MGLAVLAGRDKDSVAVRSPVLVFLTDGEATRGITNKELILSSVKDSNVEEIPIFSLAFGEGADYDLVKKLSAQNLGFARKIYEASDADKQISGFYKEISVTLLNNVTFTYLDAPISNVTETEFPNYFEGSEVIVAGRMITVDVQDNGLVLRSEIQANSVEGIRVLRADAEMEESGFDYNLTGIGDYEKITEKVWAYLTIKGLLKKAMATENETLKEGYNKRVLELSLKVRLHNYSVFPTKLHVRPAKRSACASAQSDQSLRRAHCRYPRIQIVFRLNAKTLISLCRCAG